MESRIHDPGSRTKPRNCRDSWSPGRHCADGLGLPNRWRRAAWNATSRSACHIIKTMPRGHGMAGPQLNVSRLAMPGDDPGDPRLGQLVPRGQHDGLARSADAVVDGVHGGPTAADAPTSTSMSSRGRSRGGRTSSLRDTGPAQSLCPCTQHPVRCRRGRDHTRAAAGGMWRRSTGLGTRDASSSARRC